MLTYLVDRNVQSTLACHNGLGVGACDGGINAEDLPSDIITNNGTGQRSKKVVR